MYTKGGSTKKGGREIQGRAGCTRRKNFLKGKVVTSSIESRDSEVQAKASFHREISCPSLRGVLAGLEETHEGGFIKKMA